jgi:hypothetical protein
VNEKRDRLATVSLMSTEIGSQFRLALLNSGCGLADHVNDEVGLGEHDDVTALRLDDGRPHALRWWRGIYDGSG